jgi:hypothetical protein
MQCEKNRRILCRVRSSKESFRILELQKELLCTQSDQFLNEILFESIQKDGNSTQRIVILRLVLELLPRLVMDSSDYCLSQGLNVATLSFSATKTLLEGSNSTAHETTQVRNQSWANMDHNVEKSGSRVHFISRNVEERLE